MILLIGRDGVPRLRPKLTIDIAGVIALVLQGGLDIYHYLIGRQIGVAVNGTVVNVADKSGIITPGRIPVTSIPIIIAAANDSEVIVVIRVPSAVAVNTVIIMEDFPVRPDMIICEGRMHSVGSQMCAGAPILRESMRCALTSHRFTRGFLSQWVALLLICSRLAAALRQWVGAVTGRSGV